MYKDDKRIVVTLDAGGTNFVFGAIQGCKFISQPVCYPSNASDLDLCLKTMVKGFSEVIASLSEAPVAISFAFPGPADYPHGIIGGNLPNFPSFRDGVALGPFLEKTFGLPVFINNDGNLYAYGEAMAGALPYVNSRLEELGSTKRYKNMIGVTFGTGYGCGVVIDGNLLLGDNGAGGDVWCMRNYRYPNLIVEESVSIRAIQRVYREQSGEERTLTPKDIFEIAEGNLEGNAEAAVMSFEEFGHGAGDALASASCIVDGLVVIGGGLTGSSKYFMPALLETMTENLSMLNGTSFSRMQSEVVYLDGEAAYRRLAEPVGKKIQVYGQEDYTTYDYAKRIAIMLTQMGASEAISDGAYVYALNHL